MPRSFGYRLPSLSPINTSALRYTLLIPPNQPTQPNRPAPPHCPQLATLCPPAVLRGRAKLDALWRWALDADPVTWERLHRGAFAAEQARTHLGTAFQHEQALRRLQVRGVVSACSRLPCPRPWGCWLVAGCRLAANAKAPTQGGAGGA